MMRRKIKTIIAMTAACALFVTGCGAAPSASGTEAPDMKEKTTSNETDTNTSSSEQGADVQNNGAYFVQVGDKVYYRSYPKEALGETALWGSFMSAPTGKESTMMCYDTKTGDVKEAFKDNGFGEISYLNGRFYLSGKDEGSDNIYMYSCLEDGSDYKKIESKDSNLFFKGVDNKTQSLLVQPANDLGYTPTFQQWQNGECKAEIGGDENNMYIASGEGFAVFKYDDSDENQYIGSFNLETGEQTILGKVPASSIRNGFDIFEKAVISDGKVYVAAGIIEGTMANVSEGVLLTGELGKKDSLTSRQLTQEEIAPGTVPFISVEAGNVQLDTGDNNKVFIIDGDLGTIATTQNGPLVEGYCKKNSDIYAVSDAIEIQNNIGNVAYLVMNTQLMAPDYNVGWRDAFTRISTKYVRLDLSTGDVKELSEEDCSKEEMLAQVWLPIATSTSELYEDTLLFKVQDDEKQSEDADQFSENFCLMAQLSKEGSFDEIKNYLKEQKAVEEAPYYLGYNGVYKAPETANKVMAKIKFNKDGIIVELQK